MKRFALLGCILFCALAPFAAEVSADVPGPRGAAAGPGEAAAEGAGFSAGGAAETGPEESGPDPTELSIILLLEAAGGGHVTWRPGWPPDLPPDLLSIPGALSVTVDFDGEEKLELVREGERFTAFPVLTRRGLIQGRGDYDDRGRILRLFWESGDAEVLDRDGDERPVLWRIFSGAYYFAALEYNGASAVETWYDEEGKALFALESGSRGTNRISSSSGDGPGMGPAAGPVTIDYNNAGLISAVTGKGETRSALYNAGGMPRYLEISRHHDSPDENINKNNENNENPDAGLPPRESYVYQWDETGRLIRLSGGAEGNRDYRYEYTLDDRGNWTELRELRMELLGPEAGEGPEGRLVPAAVRRIRRTIRYADPRSPGEN
ncbi:MAG: hypothetical protein LBC31_11065 [Treponema sp.]|nr:hypothetical protein [Treponema sp.]